MKKDDLTQVKYIGAARMKLINDAGITTIRQLSKTPLEELARIETIGEHYAKLIKAAVSESYAEKPEKAAPTKTVAAKIKDTKEISQDLGKQIKALKKQLKTATEHLKPLGKKKYLELYIDFKKRSKTLKTRLDGVNQIRGDLSKAVTKNIINTADALNATLKNVGGKPKKKIYKKCAQEIQLFSKLLKKAGS